MNIRWKLILLTIAISAGSVILSYFVLERILIASYKQLEHDAMVANMNRAYGALDYKLKNIGTQAQLYGMWSENYDFISNNGYIDGGAEPSAQTEGGPPTNQQDEGSRDQQAAFTDDDFQNAITEESDAAQNASSSDASSGNASSKNGDAATPTDAPAAQQPASTPKELREHFLTNFTASAVKGSGDDFMMIMNLDGQPLVKNAYDLQQIVELPNFPDFGDGLTKLIDRIRAGKPAEFGHGLLLSKENQIFLIGYSGVTDSAVTKPNNGIMIMGQRLERILPELVEFARLPFTITVAEQFQRDHRERYGKLQEEPLEIVPVTEEKIAGYQLLRDLYNTPIAVLHMDVKRDIYLSGIKTIKLYTLAIIATIAIVAILMSMVFSYVVATPIEKLSRDMVAIDSKEKLSQRLSSPATYETATIAANVNKLLANVQSSLKTLDETRDILSCELNSLDSAILVFTPSFQLISWNTTAERLCENREELQEQGNLFRCYPFLTPYQTELQEAVENDTVLTQEQLSYLSPQSKILRFYSFTVHSLDYQEGKAFSITINDITRAVKLNEQQAQTSKIASVGVLTGGVAHEINNPITFISSTLPAFKANLADLMTVLAEYAKLGTSDNPRKKWQEIQELSQELDIDYVLEETKDLFAKLNNGIKRTEIIMNAMHTFAGLYTVEEMKGDVKEGMDAAVLEMQKRVNESGTTLKLEGEFHAEVALSNERLKQVFVHMIKNAIDAMAGASKKELIITATQTEEQISIQLKDSGSGIDGEILPHIFDPFFTTKDVSAGTGMGLAVCKAIIEQAGGIIAVISQKDQGTEFKITLPKNMRGSS